MIPKIINYCWFGGKSLPVKTKKCIESWKKFCPDYKIVRWDESNFDVHKIRYINQAYNRGKYAFVADYVRLSVVKEFGGIYLDTDVELLKNLDDLLKYNAFFGMEEDGRVNTGIGFGAVKDSPIIDELIKVYDGASFFDGHHEDNTTCVEYSKPFFKSLGLEDKNKTQFFEDSNAIVFSTEFFCPQDMKNGKVRITKNTYSIHHYDATWKKYPKLDKYFTRIKIRIHKFINLSFGEGTYEKMKERFYEKKW